MQIDDINNSRIVEDVHISSEIISDVDELVKTSTPILYETHIHEESIIDVQDALVESSTFIHDIDISEDDTSDSEHVLLESSMPVQVASYSLVIPMINDKIEFGTVDTSIVTSSKPSEFFLQVVFMWLLLTFPILVSQ